MQDGAVAHEGADNLRMRREGAEQLQQLLASTAHDDASLVRCRASADQHFDRMLGSILAGGPRARRAPR